MSRLPTEDLTFLFTDIEESTRLLAESGDLYPDVLADHRRLVRSAVERGGGREVDSRGDEMFIVFDDTEAAVAAAVDAQRVLADHTWPGGASVRVRMGIHAGRATVADGGYVGLDVHRAARIGAAGHGGQVLLSEDAREAVAGDAAVSFRDLGQHRLHGLPAPERIFQVEAPGLASDFPALRVEAEGEFIAAATEQERAPTKVVIADDSVLLREGIARLLEDEGLNVVAQAGNADELLLRVRSYKPDVAIVDIRMPPTQTDEGLRAAKEIREKHPDVGVLVLSQYVESGYALELLSESAEGVGYLLKDRVSDVKEFADAVRRVADGGSALDPAVVSQLVGRRRGSDPVSDLSPREREVLELMAEGKSNQAIGERLFITPRAVEKHVTSIFGKLRLPATAEDHRRVLAVLAYLRQSA